MNSNEIFALIERIAATPSKLEKQALVRLHAGDPDFRCALVAALDPLITYGIEALPAYQTVEDVQSMFRDEDWQFLRRLQSRETTGGAALEEFAARCYRLSPESATLLGRIVTKDLRAGFGASTVNKAIPGLIREFPYMRCCLPKDAKLDKFDWKAGVLSQEKGDGMFVNIDVELDGTVHIGGRSGLQFPLEQLQPLVNEIRTKVRFDTESHAELLVLRDQRTLPREIGNGILNSVQQGGEFGPGEQPVCFVWDQIPLSAVVAKGRYTVPYAERLKDLQIQLLTGDRIRAMPTRVVHSLAEAYAHFRELLFLGKEGTVFKHPDMIWRDGDSKEQVKLKLEASCDLQIAAVVPGKKGTKNEGRAGSLTCTTSCGQLVVDVTVKNEAMRAEVDAHPENFVGGVITVLANAILEPSASNDKHSLFLPRMVEAFVRTDKSVADSLQRVRDQFEAAIQAA